MGLFAINSSADGRGMWWYLDMGWQDELDPGCTLAEDELLKLEAIAFREGGYLFELGAKGGPLDRQGDAPEPPAETEREDFAARMRRRRGELPETKPRGLTFDDLERVMLPPTNIIVTTKNGIPTTLCDCCGGKAVTALAGIGVWCRTHAIEYEHRSRSSRNPGMTAPCLKPRKPIICQKCDKPATRVVIDNGQWCADHWRRFRDGRIKIGDEGHRCVTCSQLIGAGGICACFPNGLTGM